MNKWYMKFGYTNTEYDISSKTNNPIGASSRSREPELMIIERNMDNIIINITLQFLNPKKENN